MHPPELSERNGPDVGSFPDDVDRAPPRHAAATASPVEPPAAPEHGRDVRRVVLGGVLGGLPGLLIVGVPMLLHSAGAISADQSQIGFIGVPLMLIGTFAGILATAGPGRTG